MTFKTTTLLKITYPSGGPTHNDGPILISILDNSEGPSQLQGSRGVGEGLCEDNVTAQLLPQPSPDFFPLSFTAIDPKYIA